MSCCSHEEIMAFQTSFQKNANKLRIKMIYLEALITLFIGDKTKEFFKDKRKFEECEA